MTPKKLFYIMLIVLLSTLSLAAGGMHFANSYLQEQSETIGSLKAQNKLLGTELINAKRTTVSLAIYGHLSAEADRILPDTKNQSEAILLINDIGREVGVRTESFSFLGTDGEPSDKSQTEPLHGTQGILVFPVQVKFEATYDQTIGWLRLAEKNQRKMQVSTITISVRDGDGEYNPADALSVTIKVNAYMEG